MVPPGATLILFTDGLIERRGESLDLGFRRLEEALGDAPSGLDPMVDWILEALGATSNPRDDVAVLAIRRMHGRSRPFRASLPLDSGQLRRMRSALWGWLREEGVDEEDANDLVLACSEVCANAIEHSAASPDSTVAIEAVLDHGTVSVRVSDRGQWRSPVVTSDRGMGLRIVQSVMDSVDVDARDGGTEVAFRRRLRGPRVE